MGEERLVLVLGRAYLDDGAEAPDLGVYRTLGLRVDAQEAFAGLVFRTGVERLVHHGAELVVEVVQHRAPLLLALGYLVEVLLHLGREVIVHDAREVVQQEVVDHNTYVGGDELALVGAGHLDPALLRDELALERDDGIVALLAFLVALHHILALLDGADGGGVGARAANAQFLELVYKRCLAVALRPLGEAFGGDNFAARELLTLGERGQDGRKVVLVVLLLLVRLVVDFQETVELDDLAGSDEVGDSANHLRRRVNKDVDRSLFNLGIGHLAGNGALPDKLVEAAFLYRALDRLLTHVGGTDGLVGLLRALRTGVVVAHLGVFGTVEARGLLLRGVDAEVGKVHGVGTHVGDASVLVEVLSHHHGLAHGVAQFAGGLLLQGTGGEGWGRRALHGLLLYRPHGEGGLLTLFEELLHLVDGLEAGGQCRAYLALRAVGVLDGEDAAHVVVGLALEGLQLALTLNDETHGHALHATGREGRLNLAPQHGRQLEAHQAVEHAACLLGIH